MREDEATRLFSVEEVNALIPRLELIIERMQRRALELRELLQRCAAESDASVEEIDVAQILQRWPDKRELVNELQSLVEEIDGCGGQFKGLELGLVDFPCEVEGELALLCWQYGEKEVGHWHSLEGGFTARRALPAARDAYLQ